MAARERIRVLITKEDDIWVAQCLEYDISAQAHDPEQASLRLISTIYSEYAESIHRHGKAFAGINRAPNRLYDIWERRAKIFKPAYPVSTAPLDIDVEFSLVA